MRKDLGFLYRSWSTSPCGKLPLPWKPVGLWHSGQGGVMTSEHHKLRLTAASWTYYWEWCPETGPKRPLSCCLMTTPSTSSQAELVPQPSSVHSLSQITRSLFISNAVTANSRFMLSSYHITTVISVSVEAVNTVFEGIQYLKVPVADSPSAHLYDFFDPIADRIHSVDMKQGRALLHCVAGVSRSATLCIAFLMKYRHMSLLNAHKWTKLCRPIIRPNNGFWEQLIHYEYKLFTKTTVRMINSPVGRIPDIYQKELHLMMPE